MTTPGFFPIIHLIFSSFFISATTQKKKNLAIPHNLTAVHPKKTSKNELTGALVCMTKNTKTRWLPVKIKNIGSQRGGANTYTAAGANEEKCVCALSGITSVFLCWGSGLCWVVSEEADQPRGGQVTSSGHPPAQRGQGAPPPLSYNLFSLPSTPTVWPT